MLRSKAKGGPSAVGGKRLEGKARRTMDEGRGTREDRDLTSFFSSSPGRIQVGLYDSSTLIDRAVWKTISGIRLL